MLVTVDKLSIDFCEDEAQMQHKLQELKKLEKAIEDSAHYKLLSGKTQMISSGKGKVKKERSRLVHTKTIAYQVVKPIIEEIYDRIAMQRPELLEGPNKRIFELNREIAITRGMCMIKAHDIGHVAFGHEGERAIDEFFQKRTVKSEIETILGDHLRCFGTEYEERQGHLGPYAKRTLSFEHNELGALLLNQIIQEQGIDITDAERSSLIMGVLGHSTSRTPFVLLQDDIIAQIVRVADKVEYINSDYDEIAGLVKIDYDRLTPEQIEYMKKPVHERIAETNKGLIEEAFSTGVIYEKNPTMKSLKGIRKSYDNLVFLYDGDYAKELLKDLLAVLDNPRDLQLFYKLNPGAEVVYPKETLDLFRHCRDLIMEARDKGIPASPVDLQKAYDLVTTEQMHFKSVLQGENSERISLIYEKLLQYYYENPDKIPECIARRVNPIDNVPPAEIAYTLHTDGTPLERTLEYISLLDDQELLNKYHELYEERLQKGAGYGIDPIKMIDVKELSKTRYNAEVRKYSEDLAKRSHTRISTLRGRREYNARSRAFFHGGRLTRRGEEVMNQNYQERFREFEEDYQMFISMKESDERRNNQARENR